jgi:hypothetical protein
VVQEEISKLFTNGDIKMFYVMPQTWIFTELGMTNDLNAHNNPQANSATHGNPEDTNPTKKRVLISMAKLIRNTEPSKILNYLKQQIPKLYVDIDLERMEVISISKPPVEGIYSDVPEPVF